MIMCEVAWRWTVEQDALISQMSSGNVWSQMQQQSEIRRNFVEGAVDRYSIIPNFFHKKIFIPIEVFYMGNVCMLSFMIWIDLVLKKYEDF